MIRITKMSGVELSINNDLIVEVEETPDTVITFINGDKIVVREKENVIVQKIIDFKRQIYQRLKT